MFQKTKWCPKSKIKVNVLNLSDKVKILDLLKVACLYQELDSLIGKTN
jgi:hypothetical protein